MAAKKRKSAIQMTNGIDDIIKGGGKLASKIYKKEVNKLGGESVVSYLKHESRKSDDFLKKVREAGGLNNYLKKK